MNIKKIALFVYDFPHKKTQDFITRLLIEGYLIEYVIAAPFKKLNIPSSSIRVAPKNVGLVHPRIICKRFKIKYYNFSHDSSNAINLIRSYPVDLFVISGARILSKKTITACLGKILNIHPGLLPEVRGLDTFQWSIYYKKPLGITAHLITPKIDSGLLIYKEKLPLLKDDSPLDVNLRLLEYQTDVLIRSLDILKKTKLTSLENLSQITTPYNTKMDSVLEKKVLKNYKNWLKKNYEE